ncbi:hypothetical protein LTR53_005795 [Teratosphaeriaceae sp. CCFEE 6253]|nr:hypothetical protein LTR53_005795 [Teratosphaeriaceae sp. CCFEE 6253]
MTRSEATHSGQDYWDTPSFTGAQPQQRAKILDLPVELRLEIYESALATSQRGPIELYKAAAPTNALLLVCRQMADEVRGLYRTAYRCYWLETPFNIAMGNDLAASDPIVVEFSIEDLAHIRHLQLSVRADTLVAFHQHNTWASTYSNLRRLAQAYDADDVLDLKRCPRVAWLCLEVNGDPEDVVTSRPSSGLISVTHDTCWLSFDGEASMAHWVAGAAFQPITVEELRALAGIDVVMKEHGRG